MLRGGTRGKINLKLGYWDPKGIKNMKLEVRKSMCPLEEVLGGKMARARLTQKL